MANNKKIPARNGLFPCLLCCLLPLLPPAAWSEALVTQIQGEVTVKLPGFAKQAKLFQGTWLPDNVKISASASGSQYWVLCPGSDKPHNIRPKGWTIQHCPKRESSKMRGGDDEDTPFILLPNQSALAALDRVIWSGPRDAEYAIMLIQTDAEGVDDFIHEWEPGTNTYQKSGIHEFKLSVPFPLVFSDAVTYKLEIENMDISQSSAKFDEILIKTIKQPPPQLLMGKGNSLLREQQIEPDSELGKLVLAAYLVNKGHRAEAYTLLSTLQGRHFRAQAQLLRARILYQPGAPVDVVVKQYGKALEFAVADNDDLSALVACRAVTSPSPLALSNEGRIYRSQIVNKPEFAPYCPES